MPHSPAASSPRGVLLVLLATAAACTDYELVEGTKSPPSEDPEEALPGIIDVQPGELVLGSLAPDSAAWGALTVSNLGEGDLHVERMELGGAAGWTLATRISILGPQEDAVLELGFVAAEVGSFPGELSVYSDDPSRPVLTVPLSVTVAAPANHPPGPPMVSITPDNPVEGSALTCVIVEPSNDEDGDDVEYDFAWLVDGVAWSGGTDTQSWPGDSIRAGETLAGEVWTCVATPYDGTITGESASAQTTILDDSEEPEEEWAYLSFEEYTPMSNSTGTTVPTYARVSDDYLAAYGLRLTSAGGFVAVVNLGTGHATDGFNGLGGSTSSGALSYQSSAPVVGRFYAADGSPTATSSVSLSTDLAPTTTSTVTLTGYDIDGNAVDSITMLDTGGTTLTVSAPAIHIFEFLGNGSVAVDELTFPVPPL